MQAIKSILRQILSRKNVLSRNSVSNLVLQYVQQLDRNFVFFYKTLFWIGRMFFISLGQRCYSFYTCDKRIMPDEAWNFFLTLKSQWKAIRLLSTGQIKTFFHFVYTIYNQTQFRLNFWKFITSRLDMETKFRELRK